MSIATVQELRHDFNSVLLRIAQGEAVTITKRGKEVARLVPPLPAPSPSPKRRKIKWPDFAARAKEISGDRPPGNFIEWYCENRE